MRLEPVNLTVCDLDRSIAFYCDLLDLHVRWKAPIDAGGLGAHVGDDRSYLALFQAAESGPVEPAYGRRREGDRRTIRKGGREKRAKATSAG